MREAISRSYRGLTDFIGTKTKSEQFYTESAVMPAQIEQRPSHRLICEWLASRVDAVAVANRSNTDAETERPAFLRWFSFLKNLFTLFFRSEHRRRRSPPLQNPSLNSTAVHTSMDITSNPTQSQNATAQAGTALCSPTPASSASTTATSIAVEDRLLALSTGSGVDIHQFSNGTVP